MSKEIRRAKVSAKLAVRKVKREDTSTKIGLGVVAGFILPCLTMISISLF
tara:strand:- start:3360 stop:3509 length:150 start_codon:yes stop_codon:yes gene_type:complete